MAKVILQILWLAAIISTCFAQVGPQATQLPACIKTCDPNAMAFVNCTNADQYCHCVRQNGILHNITACADKLCANPSESLYTFTTLFGQVCAPFNISVPVLGSNNTSTNGTVSPPPSPSLVPYTGGASARLSFLDVSNLVLVVAVSAVVLPS